MTKRISLSLLVVVLLTLFAVPAAMADHCYRCKIVPAPQVSYCITNTSTTFGGFPDCYSDETGCYVSGTQCPPHTASLSTPLATEYRVAAVERLDEPQTAASETLVATVSAAPSTR